MLRYPEKCLNVKERRSLPGIVFTSSAKASVEYPTLLLLLVLLLLLLDEYNSSINHDDKLQMNFFIVLMDLCLLPFTSLVISGSYFRELVDNDTSERNGLIYNENPPAGSLELSELF